MLQTAPLYWMPALFSQHQEWRPVVLGKKTRLQIFLLLLQFEPPLVSDGSLVTPELDVHNCSNYEQPSSISGDARPQNRVSSHQGLPAESDHLLISTIQLFYSSSTQVVAQGQIRSQATSMNLLRVLELRSGFRSLLKVSGVSL